MSNPDLPKLYQDIKPPKTRGRKRKSDDDDKPSAEETFAEELASLGPILLRARNTHDNYVLLLKGDVELQFHRAEWADSGDVSFITLYTRAADHWRAVDVCIDDVSTVSLVLPDRPSKPSR